MRNYRTNVTNVINAKVRMFVDLTNSMTFGGWKCLEACGRAYTCYLGTEQSRGTSTYLVNY